MEASWRDVVVPLLILTGVAFAFAVLKWWHFGRSRALLQRWASREGLQLLAFEYRWFSRGPFTWTTATNSGQAVYRITAALADGETKQGWACVGRWLIGLLSSRVDVRWDVPESAFPVVFPVPVKDDEIVRP